MPDSKVRVKRLSVNSWGKPEANRRKSAFMRISEINHPDHTFCEEERSNEKLIDFVEKQGLTG